MDVIIRPSQLSISSIQMMRPERQEGIPQHHGEEQKSRSGSSDTSGFSRGGGIWTNFGSVHERQFAISPPTIPRGASIGGAFAPAQVGVDRSGVAARSSQQSFNAQLPQAHGDQGSRAPPQSAGHDSQDARWFRPVHMPQETSLYSNIQQQQLRAISPPTNTTSSPFVSGRPAPYQHVSPSRFRPASAASNQSIESRESASSQTSSFRKGATSGQSLMRKRSRRSPSPQTTLGSEEDTSEKSPLPQNLRGDPFRSAKVKTELCRNYETEKGCPFGSKCNYAHGEHELKYTKLMDLELAGLVDIEIFRTRPCPTWVATGSCPFDQRCLGTHDPILSGNHPSWLPHAETLVNSIGSSLNVDKLYHQQLAALYSCSPIYGYVPKRKWKSDPDTLESAWNHFYAFVCNLDEESNSSTSDRRNMSMSDTAAKQQASSPPKDRPRTQHQEREVLPEIYRIAIALQMRERRIAQCYAYLPTHLLFGELCMVLQENTFVVHTNITTGEWGISEVNGSSATQSDTSRLNGREVVVAHEIAFGPVGDPSVRQVAIWFNISSDDLVRCTSQQAKRHKRSRHRIKTVRQRERIRTPMSTEMLSAKMPAASPDSIQEGFNPTVIRPFYNHQPIDSAAFDLISDIMRHRLHFLDLSSRASVAKEKRHALQSLKEEEQQFEAEEKRLKKSFESQRRHWLTWSWPVTGGGYVVDDSTDVPPVDGRYSIAIGKSDNFQTEFFFGVDDGRGGDVVSRETQMTLYFLWKSFLMNLQLEAGCPQRDSKRVAMSSLDKAFHRLRRLSVFRSLSRGIQISGINRALPALPREADRTSAVESLLGEWQSLVEHYEDQNSPLRNLEAKQDAAFEEANGTSSPEETSESNTTKLLKDAVMKVTRMQL